METSFISKKEIRKNFTFLDAMVVGEKNVFTKDGYLILAAEDYKEIIRNQLQEKDYKNEDDLIIIPHVIEAISLEVKWLMKISLIFGNENLDRIYVKLKENGKVGDFICL